MPLPVISVVYGEAPGAGSQYQQLQAGYLVDVYGTDLDTVQRVRLPGFEVLRHDFLDHASNYIQFLLTDGPHLASGHLRVYAGTSFDQILVTVLRPEAGWRHPDVITVRGLIQESYGGLSFGRADGGTWRVVGSSRMGDGGDPTYTEDVYPYKKMGYDADGTRHEEIVVVGISNGSVPYGFPGVSQIQQHANMAGDYPPDPPGVENWLFEYRGQTSDYTFRNASPTPIIDAMTAPMRMEVSLFPDYLSPRLSDTGWAIYTVPPAEVTTHDFPGYPDTHLTKREAWFATAPLIDSGDGPNYEGSVSWDFDDGTLQGFLAISTVLTHSGGFSGGGMLATGPGEFRSPVVGAAPTGSYRMDCWIGDAPADGGTVTVGIVWIRRDGSEISTTWGDTFDVQSHDNPDGNFVDRTWVNTTAPDDPEVWSRQLVFSFSGCASLQVDSVNFRNDFTEYAFIRDLSIPVDQLYVSSRGYLYVTLVGVTPAAIHGSSEVAGLLYQLEGPSGLYQPRVTYRPTDWRYWLPLPIGDDDPLTGAGWVVGGVAWG